MARFECKKSPGLLLIGVGEFVDGSLDVDEQHVEKVRRMAKVDSLGIVESDGQSASDDQEDIDPALFDPSEHTADEVLEYMSSLDDLEDKDRSTELRRVVEAERSGKNRKGILDKVQDDSGQE